MLFVKVAIIVAGIGTAPWHDDITELCPHDAHPTGNSSSPYALFLTGLANEKPL